MFMLTRYAAWLSGALLAVAAIGVAHAEYVDPPSRVARLSYTRGDVSFSPGGESEWVNATRNRPLIRGDRLWAGRGALAELQAGNATFRVDEGTSLSIINLDDETAQVEITQGTLNLRVGRIYEGQIFEVDTPTLAFVVSRPGEYRIDVDARENHTTVAVWDGGGEAYGDKANFRIREGEAIRFYDTRLTDYEAFDIPRPDEFDRFCSERNAAMERSASRRYVSEDLIGYSDLDEYGSWTTESDYGAVWYPTRVAADWAPYRDGHWIWQEPWGWTWVDDSAWGFAPFHYGRWAYVRNRWGWIPGPIASRPVYAPALVAFVGGHNWSVGITAGRPIGWFPLGPREIYVPPYRSSRGYFTSVNVTNTVINNTYITNIYNDYSRGRNVTGQINYFNRGVNGAVTAVSTDAFVNSRGVRGAQVRFDRDMAMRGETSQVATIAPVSRSVLGAGRAASNAPQREVFDRAVVARTAPPREIASFADRQQALQRTPGRALTPEVAETLPSRGRSAGAANAPQRVRVIDDNAARNARTLDAEPGSRGGPPPRSRAPDGASNPPGRVATDREAPPSRDRGNAPSRDMPTRDAPNRDAPSREAPNREAPVRGRDAQPTERDFTRPNVRERGEPTIRREPIREAPNQREAVQREAPVDRAPRDAAQREDAQRGREQMQRQQQAEREQAQRQRDDEQRGREQMQRQQQAEREQTQRQRDDEQRGREQMQRQQQEQREQVQRQRDDEQRGREQMQRQQQEQREQQAQREQVQRQREDEQRGREQMQRQQQEQREQVQRQREDEQRGREQMQRQQQEQREQQQAQREQMQRQQEAQQAQRQQQAQQVQQQREARQREAPQQQQRDQAPQRGRGNRDDGDDRKKEDDRR
ncbi:DUF6600 domain-containing protein [Tahibacter soli]|uniref:FecR family protein n=1 Tax=Tahibacter soli TaxID=2983605 RepID=A0A9X3YFV7_9GAMM|nr:DUF6600 domain-containing protein [Tahibacter soli]MDC8011152.1 hypothetical protein [Tahibacter soli]